MSTTGILWAYRQTKVDPGMRWTLFVLADHAHDDGRYAFPSVGTIAIKTGQNRATIHRHLRHLETEGYIVRGDQSATGRYPKNRRPTVYDLNYHRGHATADLRLAPVIPTDQDLKQGSQRETPSGVSPCDPNGPRGRTDVAPGVASCDPNQELKPKHLTHLPAQGDGLARAREATPDGVAACRQALHHQETPA